MILGELLHAMTIAYSPWFERQADSAVFNIKVVATSRGGAPFKVNVQTKNSQDADADAIVVGDFSSPPQAAGIYSTGVVTGLAELVRYEYDFSDDSDPSKWVHFEMMDPEWLVDTIAEDAGSANLGDI